MPRARKPANAVKAEVQQRLEEIEFLSEHAKRRGLAFASPSEEELTKRARGETSNSPYFYYEMWTSGTVANSPAIYEAGFANPDPVGRYTFVTVFFGLANIAADISEGFDARDPAWPYVSSDSSYVASGGTAKVTFNYTTPKVMPGTYLGNAVLWSPNYFDVGAYFDRGFFEVTLH